MLLNAAKCQGYSFTIFELLRENQKGRDKIAKKGLKITNLSESINLYSS